jgi:hypothetical protein
MRRVLPALATELAEFQTLGRGLLVLRRRVVPVFARAALQCHDLTHKTALLFLPLFWAINLSTAANESA